MVYTDDSGGGAWAPLYYEDTLIGAWTVFHILSIIHSQASFSFKEKHSMEASVSFSFLSLLQN